MSLFDSVAKLKSKIEMALDEFYRKTDHEFSVQLNLEEIKWLTYSEAGAKYQKGKVSITIKREDL